MNIHPSELLQRLNPFDPKYRYHFIHIPKNGGVSVRRALRRIRYVSVSKPYHYRYVDIADKVGRELQFFCIVRNPWSRTASRYEFARQSSIKWPHDDPRRIYISKATFEDFVRDQRKLPIPKHPEQPWMGPMNSWFNHLEWITDEEGKVACDCLRLENLTDDLEEYFQRKIDLPRRNVTRKQYDYRAMYSDELAEIVATTFEDDIEYFGFDFESAATRNIAVR